MADGTAPCLSNDQNFLNDLVKRLETQNNLLNTAIPF